eukprot:CAMPEP_0183765062 /NCGR_PEP_ID=MMETSP0739-20130205/10700_1 /TAXON_ID=385413 /ORGANISM="Thalassiosira miniscula, Strain CCMP1093" /LENGTH=681 /DNA_ID=CAMNT_0026003681 /DNA_START=14 /DNA_END=2059 /DNA_ORIENTATION=-
MTVPPSSSSSAKTAQEIKSLLQQLRKSSRQRKKKRSGSSSNTNTAIDRDDALRLEKLRKIFAGLVERQEFDLNANSNAAGTDGDVGGKLSQWKAWLATQHEAFVGYLIEGILDGRTTALRTFCGVLASSPVDIVGLTSNKTSDDDANAKKQSKMISERLLNKLLEAVAKSRSCLEIATSEKTQEGSVGEEAELLFSTEEPTLALLETEFLRPHRDAQYFVYKGMHQIALDLLAGLERLRKKKKEDESSGAMMILLAEKNVGIVAENLCRLLMMMDYVPKKQSDLEDEAGFLFPPPVLAENGDNNDDDDNDAMEENDSDSDDSSEESDSSEEEEEEASNKKRKLTGGNNSNKRSKKTKLITWQQPYKHRHAHQEAWLSVLRLPNLPSRTQRRVLQHLSTYVLTICPSPLRFAEYFTRSFRGGVVNVTAEGSDTSSTTSNTHNNNSLTAILSLHGLFILMLNHQLEYPQFYNSLYTLLHPRILYTKHRTRFLRLLSQSLLSNSMLPAYVVASFCKKLCRMALSGPPSGGLFVLALVSNLLRKHGECACLIHRKSNIINGEGGMEDVFVEEVDDLVKTRALESSLWELTALEKHYHPAISTLAKSIGTEDDATTPMHDMEDFMVHTYKSLFEQEKKRLGSTSVANSGGGGAKKKKGASRVSLTFVEPEGLFTKDDVFADFFHCS